MTARSQRVGDALWAKAATRSPPCATHGGGVREADAAAAIVRPRAVPSLISDSHIGVRTQAVSHAGMRVVDFQRYADAAAGDGVVPRRGAHGGYRRARGHGTGLGGQAVWRQLRLGPKGLPRRSEEPSWSASVAAGSTESSVDGGVTIVELREFECVGSGGHRDRGPAGVPRASARAHSGQGARHHARLRLVGEPPPRHAGESDARGPPRRPAPAIDAGPREPKPRTRPTPERAGGHGAPLTRRWRDRRSRHRLD